MRRRVIAVLAALGLVATTVVGLAPAASAVEPEGAVYVALGDSEAAGTGNLPYVDEDCKRSKKAYPALVASWLGPQIPVPFSYVNAACAGATTDDVEGQIWMMRPTALGGTGELGPNTELVTLTVGANNLGWQNLLIACAADPVSDACGNAVLTAQTALGVLPFQIVSVLAHVHQAAPNAMIVVTDYPLLFGQFSGSCSVGNWQGKQARVSAATAAQANLLVAGLDQAIATGVLLYQNITPDSGPLTAQMIPAFAGHGLCDSGDRWISGLIPGAPVADRGFHANSAGQVAWAEAIKLAMH